MYNISGVNMVKIKRINGTEGRRKYNPKLGKDVEEIKWTNSEEKTLRQLKK